MLGDRESLGSVLEGTWLTSTGALVRILSGDFEFSFNEPGGCDGDGVPTSTAEGSLCLFAIPGRSAISGRSAAVVDVEVCAAADVRQAAELLLGKLPRPTEPQQPSRMVLRAPVWSTWARFKMDVDQPKVEAYAAEIASRGFPRSHLEVDDRWSHKYGDLSFDELKFPDAAGMVRKLHARGFQVTLWVTPFAEPAADAYAEGAAAGYWLRAADGSPLRITWWQGAGVALNVSDAAACRWFERRLRALRQATGVDGFKFDAGEAVFVPEGAMANPNDYCALWAGLAARFGGGGEVRCADRSQAAGVWTREFDKDSRWGRQNGLRAMVVAALQLGVLGYPFVLPDMFSIAPWQYDEATVDACRRALELREARLPTLEVLASRAVATGAPIVRPLWWSEPLDPTCQWVDDQFMLGDRTLVAPVLEPGVTSRPVYLPRGRWRVDGSTQQVFQGPRWLVDFRVPLDALAVFERVFEDASSSNDDQVEGSR